MKLHNRIKTHIKQHHKKYLWGIFGSFAIIKMIILFAGFLGLATLVSTFAAEPEDSIINTYYGANSIYTSERASNSCNTGSMTVQYIQNYATSGINAIPATLTTNTIYVLLSGSHITSRQIALTTCSAIVGSGNVTLYSNGQVGGLLYANNKVNTIIDAIKIDGTNNGTGGTHTANSVGIFLSYSSNNTINNSQIYNNSCGIKLEYSSNNTINNSQMYNNIGNAINNGNGIYIMYSGNNSINNSQAYNNTINGIAISAPNNTINNSQFYNNGSDGIGLYDAGAAIYNTTNNTINNSQSYNNGQYGINLFNCSKNTINNSQAYNNNAVGIYASYAATNNKYYGTVKAFGNILFNMNGAGLAPGLDSDFPGFFSGGVLDTSGTMSCDWMTNPLDNNGSFLINTMLYSTCNLKGSVTTRSGSAPRYLYGSNILKQTQPVKNTATGDPSVFAWSNIPWNVNKYIGEINPIPYGLLSLAGGQSYTLTNTIQAELTIQEPVEYILSGDFVGSPLIGTLNGTETEDITLSPGYGTKYITVRYFTGERERIITKSINYPDSGDIPFILQYFGTGSAYTTGWASNTCNPESMVVQYINNYATNGINTIPEILNSNTIYVLLSGSHITSRTINLVSCSAIVGSGDVKVYSTTQFGYGTNGIFYANSKVNTIINNIKIDGTNNGVGGTHSANYYGIYLYSSSNNTIDNSQFYNNNYGIYVKFYSSNNTINNSQTYNNGQYGIYLYSYSSNNIINNSQAYNNNNGISSESYSSNNIINNSQVYNNTSYGILLASFSSNNTINNSQVYNNNNGIYVSQSSTNTINNSQVYNNGQYGISLSSSSNNKYYGTLKVFGNTTSNINGAGLAAGLVSDFSDFFSGGVLDTSGSMSCDWITNPMDNNGIFLIDTTLYSTCNRKGKVTARLGSAPRYLYGSNILKQTQPIKNTATGDPSVFVWSNLTWDTNKYIGEVNSMPHGLLSLASGQQYTLTNTIQAQLTVQEPVSYEVYGDIEGAPLTGTLNGTETKDITLSPGYGTKYITVRYFTGERERIITKSINYPDSGDIPFILQYFGTGSAYTTGWASNTCNPESMVVQYINNYATNGINTIPATLAANTLYVLLSGSHITSRTINLTTCSAIVGSGNVTLYSNGQLTNGLLYANSKVNTIVDTVKIDGTNNGIGGTHSANTYGIYLYSSSNNTINNSQTYNNTSYGIYVNSYSSNNTINNSQSYNNTSYGICLNSYSSNNTINNSQVYNNSDGITISSSNNTINNSQVYNNVSYGINLSSSTNNKYYGTLKVFGNITSDINGEGLAAGLDSDFPDFFSGGVLDTSGTMSCDRITNPLNNNGIFLIDTNLYPTCNKKTSSTSRSGNDIQYLYGSNILQQKQPIKDVGVGYPSIFAWSNLVYDTNRAIASDTDIVLGSLSGDTVTSTPNISIILTPFEAVDYELSGDFVGSPMVGSLTNTETISLSLTSGYAYKHIAVRYFTGEGSTTIAKIINYVDTNSLPFIYYGPNSPYTAKRNTNTCSPINMNIEYINDYTTSGINTIPENLATNTIYILLSGSHITSRTINLTGCSAIIGSGDVTLYSNGQLTNGLLYVNSGVNIIIDAIKIDGTNDGIGGAHIANNYGFYLYSSSNNTINNSQGYNNESYGIYLHSSSSNNTIDNSQFYNNNYGIYLYFSSSNNTIDNSQAYNNGSYGIYLYSSSSNNIINNSQVYNNNTHGIYLRSSKNNTINNSQVYNNSLHGIYIYSSSSNNTINNSQIYNNNSNGIYIYSSSTNNTINNSQAYNNGNYGIYLYSSTSNNIINNSQAYNNGNYGIYLSSSTNNKYYGTLKIFENGASGISGAGLTTGLFSDFPSFFSGGVIDTSGTMSCDWITNPLDNNGIFLIDITLYSTCNLQGKVTERLGSDPKYLYGSNILKQTQSVKNTATGNPSVFVWSTLPRDAIKYIAEINPLDIISPIGSISYNPTSGSMVNTNVIATLTLNESGTITSEGGNTHTFTTNGSFTFDFQDLAGNTGEAIAIVNWIDKEAPVITLNGSGTIDILYGDNYTELGATWSDNVDSTGDVFGISGTVNTGVVGTYMIEYFHVDNAGNTGNTFRTVNILDTIAPVVTLNGSGTIDISYGDTYIDSGATWSDNVDGTGNDVIISGTVNTGLVGTYTIEYFYVDHAGNTGNSVFRIVNILAAPTPPATNNGGGGGPGLIKDACPTQRDCSDSYYDSLCGPCSFIEKIIDIIPFHGAANKPAASISGSIFSSELNNAYLRAYGYDITTMPTIQKANMEGKLLRKDMAKMISNFAINVLGKTVSTGATCTFADMKSLDKITQYYAMAACRLGLMGYASDGVTMNKNFNPEQEVDRAQFGTILSRLLRGVKNNGNTPYYLKHLQALKTEGIMTQIDTPIQKEMRGRVMLMMQRIFEKK